MHFTLFPQGGGRYIAMSKIMLILSDNVLSADVSVFVTFIKTTRKVSKVAMSLQRSQTALDVPSVKVNTKRFFSSRLRFHVTFDS